MLFAVKSSIIYGAKTKEWDEKISQSYGCYYKNDPAEKYISFCKITKTIADSIKDYIVKPNKTFTKLIDEYNYARYTKGWI